MNQLDARADMWQTPTLLLNIDAHLRGERARLKCLTNHRLMVLSLYIAWCLHSHAGVHFKLRVLDISLTHRLGRFAGLLRQVRLQRPSIGESEKEIRFTFITTNNFNEQFCMYLYKT